MSGIYILRNDRTGETYVGSTTGTDIRAAIAADFEKLRAGTFAHSLVQASFYEYPNDFSADVLADYGDIAITPQELEARRWTSIELASANEIDFGFHYDDKPAFAVGDIRRRYAASIEAAIEKKSARKVVNEVVAKPAKPTVTEGGYVQMNQALADEIRAAWASNKFSTKAELARAFNARPAMVNHIINGTVYRSEK